MRPYGRVGSATKYSLPITFAHREVHHRRVDVGDQMKARGPPLKSGSRERDDTRLSLAPLVPEAKWDLGNASV